MVVPDPMLVLPIPDGIYLVPVDSVSISEDRIPEIEASDSYQAEVDERDGRFVFPSVDVGVYVVVVRTTAGVQVPSHFRGSGDLVLVEVSLQKPDENIFLGDIRVP
jgi:hypothetical protein